MSKRAIVALALLALALAGYIAVFERSSVTSSELAGRSGRVLTSFVRDKVERLTIQRKGSEVVLTRNKLPDGQPSSFQVRAPFVAKADDDVVDQLLGELEWLSARRTLEAISAEDQRRFGLTAPRYRVRFAAGRSVHTLAVGNSDVHGEGVYVRVDDEPRAYVVPKTIAELLAHEPGHYRDKQLFSALTVAWAHQIELTDGGRAATLVHDGTRWLTDGVYADGKRIDALLHGMAELRAARYLDASQQAQAVASLASPTLRVSVTVRPPVSREDQKTRSFLLEVGGSCGDQPGERYARASSTDTQAVFVCIADSELKPLSGGGAPLHEPRLFSSELSSITGFVLARGNDKLALVRDGERWKPQGGATTEQTGPIDREAVEAWLADLAAARATMFSLLSLDGFAERGSLTLELADGGAGTAKSERIAIGELLGADQLVVRRGDELLRVSFPGSLYDRLLPAPGRFQSLDVWKDHQPSEVTRIDARAGTHARVLTLVEGAWQGSQPLDSDRVRELVRALLDLRALAYLSPEPRAAHGFGQGARVELALSNGGALTLELGAATDRGAYAKLDGRAVIEVGRETASLLTELAGGPRSALPTPEEEDEEDESGHDHAH